MPLASCVATVGLVGLLTVRAPVPANVPPRVAVLEPVTAMVLFVGSDSVSIRQ